MVADASQDVPTDVVVLAAGVVADDDPVPALPTDGAVVIAADAGLALAAGLGLHVDVVTGDMDSVAAAELAAAREAGAHVDTHPVDKDRTDLAIALDHALAHAPARVTVVGGHGGRLDHHLANLLLLASPRYVPLEITAHMGRATVSVIRHDRALAGEPGELVSLLPVHGAVHGVSTSGLRFALTDDTLDPGSSRGVSNEFTGQHAQVRVRDGVLVAVQPGGSIHPKEDPR